MKTADLLRELRRWWKGGEENESGYRSGLVRQLRAEHVELLDAFDALRLAAERRDALRCRAHLDRFAVLLQHHLSAENRHLYGYFARQRETPLTEQVDAMAAEMIRVGKTLHRFVRKYAAARDPLADFPVLIDDLTAVSAELRRRIEKEEALLYPLYDRLAPP